MEKAKQKNVKVVFPVDFITADKFDKDATVWMNRFDVSAQLIPSYIFDRLVLPLAPRAFLMGGWDWMLA